MNNEEKKQALRSFVSDHLDAGADPQALVEKIRDKGWSDKHIKEALAPLDVDLVALDLREKENSDEKEDKKTAKDTDDKEDETTDSSVGADVHKQQKDKDEQSDESTNQGSGETEPPHPPYADDNDGAGDSEEETTSDDNTQEVSPQKQMAASKTVRSDEINSSQVDRREVGLDESSSSSTASIVAIALVIIVLVGAGGAFAYTQLVGSSPAGNPPSAEDIYKAHASIDSFTYKLALSGGLDFNKETFKTRDDIDQFRKALPYIPNTPSGGELPEQLQGEIAFGGTASLSQLADSETKNNFRAALGGSEMADVVDVQVRIKDKTGYVRAQKLPNIPMVSVDNLQGRWLSFSASSSPSLNFEENNNLELLDQVTTSTAVSLLSALRSSGVLRIDNASSGDLPSSGSGWRFSVYVNPKNMPAYKSEIEKILSENNPDLLESEAYQQFSGEYGSSTNRGGELSEEEFGPVIVWVDKNNRLREVRYESSLSRSELTQGTSSSPDLTGIESANWSVTLKASDYNKPISVQAPASSTPFMEAINETSASGTSPTVGDSLRGARVDSRDARRQTDLRQIQTALALYKDENGAYPDNLNQLESDYINQLPKDPQTDKIYAYTTETASADFCLGATLENADDRPSGHSKQCKEDLETAGFSVNYAIE